MTPKAKAIISHLTIIGWVVALVFNEREKDPFASFYIRQMLGMYLILLIANIIPIVNVIVSIVVFAFWLISLINAVDDKFYKFPWVGDYFQDIFKTL
jgi:uncharacterized membrane protein